METRVDPSSPVPIYHQIADALRAHIESGALPAGAALEPLRHAADRLGVNLHTVRHAYAELSREGLIESRRALGTRVLPLREKRGRPARGELFLEGMLERARSEHGLSPEELLEHLGTWIRRRSSDVRPTVHVVECSRAQCEDLAGQLAEHWEVDARPWSLEERGEPPPGPILATYFHYNEIRTRWPGRLEAVCFATIRPDGRLARAFGRSSGRKRRSVVLVELDQPTVDAVAADLSVLLPEDRFQIRRRVAETPGDVLLHGRSRLPVLFPPRAWSRLTEAQRADPRALHLRYVFDLADLDRLGADLDLRRGARNVKGARR